MHTYTRVNTYHSHIFPNSHPRLLELGQASSNPDVLFEPWVELFSASHYPLLLPYLLDQLNLQWTFPATVDFTRKVPRSWSWPPRHTCASDETSPKSATTETSSDMYTTEETFDELPRGSQGSGDEKMEKRKVKHQYSP